MKAIPSMTADCDAAVAAECETSGTEVASRQSLRSAIDLRAWFDCRRAAEIALGIAEALEDAQRGGAPPYGLQPEMIFVGDDGSVLIDGGGHDIAAKPRLAAQYLSPEAACGVATDGRSDLYALGIILYEMLTDRVPFDGNDPEVIKQKRLHRMPEPPQIFRADVPDALSDLVIRLLEKDPGKRPQRADLLRELRGVLEAEAVAEGDPGVTDTTSPDIIALEDLEPAKFRGDCASAQDDSVFDIEFNEILRAAPPAVGGAALAEQTGEPMADPLPVSPVTSVSAEDAALSPGAIDAQSASRPPGLPDATGGLSPSRDNPVAGARNHPAVGTKAERDPFDLPTRRAVEPRGIFAAAVAAQSGLEAKITRGNSSAAEPGEAGLRWLALLLIGMVIAAALVLYEIGQRVSTRSDGHAATGVPARPVVPAQPDPPPAASGHTEAGADPSRAAPQPEAPVPSGPSLTQRGAARGEARIRPKRNVAQAKRSVSHSRKAWSPRRAKRGWARRMLVF